MDGKALKYGWLLLVIWAAMMAAIASSYRSTQATKEQVYELGSTIQELRDSLSYHSPYRIQLADTQALNLQIIYALRLQLDAHYQNSWLLPDINRLLFTTDRFIEQSQVYLDNNLDLLALVDQIRVMRDRYQGQPVESFYLRLSANVLEAMFGDSATSPSVYRDLDNIYGHSNQLPPTQRQELQQILAQVSSVLGGYAQGRYIVEKLRTHDVYEQIYILRGDFERLLDRHIVVGMALTTAMFVGVLLLLRLLLTTGKETAVSEDQQSSESSDFDEEVIISQPVPAENTTPAEPIKTYSPPEPLVSAQVEPTPDSAEIDFEKMLESLNDDLPSVCMLLEVFIEDHCGDGEKIIHLMNESQEEAQRKAHSLKGVGGNLGASKLRDAAGRVESGIKDKGEIDSEALNELKSRLDRAIEEARLFLKENNTVNS